MMHDQTPTREERAATAATAATTIVNARVFDGSQMRGWSEVRFVGGVITACGADGSIARPGDQIVDAAGGTLLPGLMDTHIHLAPGALTQSLAFGVTTAIDMFSLPADVIYEKRHAESDSDVADLRSAGIGATAPGGHPSALYGEFPTLSTPQEARRFVADRVAEGSDYLKIFSGGRGRWPSLDPETVHALARAGHDRGLVVIAHVHSVAGVRLAISAEVDVIAHVPADAELDQTLIQQIATQGIAVGPTLATIENVHRDTHGSRSTSPYARAERNVRRLATAGVTILAGTDAPNPGTLFGSSLHRELELLVHSGLSPAQALYAATAAPAHVLGLADRGQIKVGMRADLLLVTGDPLTTITDTRAIRRIWRTGTLVDRSALAATGDQFAHPTALEARIAQIAADVQQRQSTTHRRS